MRIVFLVFVLVTVTNSDDSANLTRHRRDYYDTELDGQWVRVYSFQFDGNGKLIQDEHTHNMCGGVLSDVMEIVCNHCYSKKKKRRRVKRGIVDECCFSVCKFSRMRDYCGNPEDC